MNKIIRVNSTNVIVIFDNGCVLQSTCDDNTFEKLKGCENLSQDEILNVLSDNVNADKYCKTKVLLDRVKHSNVLTLKHNSVYWCSICELSMPDDFVEAVLNAEEQGDDDALEAYKNFWTLLSLNPDSRCRENLWWFLNKYGFKISKSGLFIGYRNVHPLRQGKTWYPQSLCDFVKEKYETIKHQKKSPKRYWVQCMSDDDYYLIYEKTKTFEELSDVKLLNLLDLYEEFKAVNFIAGNCGSETVYTDNYTHTFEIRIGELVSMPREKCDSTQKSCSKGLHLGAASWLKKNYCGSVGLVCLCNPAKVVAVPPIDDYGKLRTCEYLPIALIEYDEYGDVIPYNVENGFKSKWVKDVIYSGNVSSEAYATYKLQIPEIPEINKSLISEAVLNIAKQYTNKN